MKNIIYRDMIEITAKQVGNSNGGKIGDIWIITKDDSGYHGKNTRTNNVFRFMPGLIRNEHFLEFISVKRSADAKGGGHMKQSQIIGIMLQHTDGDMEYYEPELSKEDMTAIYKILEKYGDNNESIRGRLVVQDIDN